MAIDSALKRMSMLNFGLTEDLMFIPQDGGVIDTRKNVFLDLYAGITLSTRVARGGGGQAGKRLGKIPPRLGRR